MFRRHRIERVSPSEVDRPFIITQWYAKGMDSGLANNTGAGRTAKTPQDRGRFYQNLTLALLASRNCIGWHWFEYRDDNPLDLSTDLSSGDSNQGGVNWRCELCRPVLNAMREMNANARRLVRYLDTP